MMENSQNRIKEVSFVIISALRDHYTVLIMLITAAGFFFRFSGLSTTPLTSDEMNSVSLSSLSITQIWTSIDKGSIFNPPLYYWIQHFSLMPGKTEFSIRFLPALCGVLSIPAIYYLGQEFHSRDVGILAAAVLAISPYHILFSQQGTPDTLMLLINLIALIFFIQALKTDSGASWAYFGILSGVAFWVMYDSIILTFSLLLFESFERWRQSLRGSGETRIINVATIFFLITIMPLSSLIRNLLKTPGFMSLQGNQIGSAMALESLNRIFNMNEPLMIVSLILLLIGIEGLFLYDPRICGLQLFMLIVPLVLGIVLPYWTAFEPGYAFIILPAVCIGAACSYTNVYLFLSKWITVSRLQILVLFLLLFGALSFPLV
jgi:4-amino-4-deoxy-L-arabinose transferase-like glycosyltransferase